MTGNGTRAKGIRVKDELIGLIERRAARKGWTFNRWVNWAISQGLRPHVRKARGG